MKDFVSEAFWSPGGAGHEERIDIHHVLEHGLGRLDLIFFILDLAPSHEAHEGLHPGAISLHIPANFKLLKTTRS